MAAIAVDIIIIIQVPAAEISSFIWGKKKTVTLQNRKNLSNTAA